MNAIVLDNLRKCYGDLWAVDGVSFEVRRGEIFGMVGPNGAGKTTTIECLEGLRRATEGRASVVGLDPPQNLIASLDAENRVVFAVDSPIDLVPFRAIPGVSRVEQTGGRIIVFGREDKLVVRVVMALAAAKIRFRDLRTEQPSLEDVFLALTGKEMRD